jgi:hypothetical protein
MSHFIERAIGVGVLCVALHACGGGPTAGQPSPQGAISGAAAPPEPWKPGSHAAAVFERILQFRINQRQKFKLFMEAWGTSHGDVNHPALAKMQSRIVRWYAMTDADYKQLPAYMKAFSGTGPYRRLITKPGYSYVAGTVFLPCNATHLHPKFETAFAYVGGWGVGEAGRAVDAGFQRSNAYDDYAAFIRAQAFPQISKEPRFVCGHPVDFRFYAASNTELRFWARGVTAHNRVTAVEARLQHPAAYGWPANGGGTSDGVVLKRMTTIAQNNATEELPSGTSWNADGSYFGHYAGDKRPAVNWSNLVVGQVDGHGNPVGVKPWGLQESDESARAGTINYPNNPITIWFTCTGCPNEIDAINLASGD